MLSEERLWRISAPSRGRAPAHALSPSNPGPARQRHSRAQPAKREAQLPSFLSRAQPVFLLPDLLQRPGPAHASASSSTPRPVSTLSPAARRPPRSLAHGPHAAQPANALPPTDQPGPPVIPVLPTVTRCNGRAPSRPEISPAFLPVPSRRDPRPYPLNTPRTPCTRHPIPQRSLKP